MLSSILLAINALIFLIICYTVYKNFQIKKLLDSRNQENTIILKSFKDDILTYQNQNFTNIIQMLKNQLDSVASSLNNLIQSNESKFENLKNSVEQKLYRIQNDNNEKLETIRSTVEEKLNETLEKRLTFSFQLVSEQLEKVHQGLGEMQHLATGVGDLKKILSNVKTRGVWGEIQLEAILQQLLTTHQYSKNVLVNPNSNERVEFAIKIPAGDDDNIIWISVDSKFPLDVFHRLTEAWDKGVLEDIASSGKELENALKKQAKSIADKYICPPHTADFAILFLPTESLYAEAIRISSLQEHLQQSYKIVLAGPTTLAAILNSLQMGYKTHAIQKRGTEVWKLLGSVKTEFLKFSDILQKTRMKLDQASREIGNAEVRSRVINKHLRNVETLGNDNIAILKDELNLIKEE